MKNFLKRVLRMQVLELQLCWQPLTIRAFAIWKVVSLQAKVLAEVILESCTLLLQARLKNPGDEDLWLAAVRTELRAERKRDAEALLAKALQVNIYVHCCTVDKAKALDRTT